MIYPTTLPSTTPYPWDRPARKPYQVDEANVIEVDAELDTAILDRLNRIPDMEMRGVCAGHREIPAGQHTRWETVGGGTRAPHRPLLLQATSAEAYEQWLDRFPMDALNTFHTATEAGELHPRALRGFRHDPVPDQPEGLQRPDPGRMVGAHHRGAHALQNTMGVADAPRGTRLG